MNFKQALEKIEKRLPSLRTIFFLDADQVSGKIKEFRGYIRESILVVAVSNRELKESLRPWLLCVKTLTQAKGAADVVISSLVTSLSGRIETICLVSGDHFREEVREMCKLEGQKCFLPHTQHHLGLWLTLKFSPPKERRGETPLISFTSDYLKIYSKEEAFTLGFFNSSWKKPAFLPDYVDLRLEFLSRWKGNEEAFCIKYSLHKNKFLAWLHYRDQSNPFVEEAIKKWLLE